MRWYYLSLRVLLLLELLSIGDTHEYRLLLISFQKILEPNENYKKLKVFSLLLRYFLGLQGVEFSVDTRAGKVPLLPV